MRWQDIVRKAYAMCIANSENVYYREEPTKCHYTRGKCSNGTVGCVFGQILPHDEFDLKEIDAAQKDNSISSVLKCCTDIPFSVRAWCNSIQHKQDQGRTWGEALCYAEDMYGLEVDDLLRENP